MPSDDAGRPGRRLAEAFRQATAKRPGMHEDELLQALGTAIEAMAAADGVEAETHAGQRTYVAFEPREELGGGRRHCELADALLLAYRPASPPQVRLTFLQSRRRASPLPSVEGLVPLARARASVYHWDLLHRRPAIEPVGQVRAPGSLLAEAHLPSVASFGFFHRPRDETEPWRFHYASAGFVAPWGEWPPAEKPRRTVRFPDATAWRTVEGHRETISAAGLADLGELIAELAVGTPVGLPTASEHDRLVAGWLAAVLAALVRRAEPGEADLANELHERLSASLESGGLIDIDSRVGAPPIAIVRSKPS